MKIMMIIVVLTTMAPPVWAQTKLVPKSAATGIDKCAPIGRTEDGKLVYSMKCENLPVAAAPVPQVDTREAPPEPEVRRTGIFGLSREYKRPDE